MPSLTMTIEENSPIISYSSGWGTGTSESDGLASRYSESSFMASQVAGVSASFVFNGTGVQIFGAKRGNHGPYAVQVDDTVYPTMNGSSPDPGLFQQSLFAVDGLNQGQHKVTITNQGASYVDVDFITWTTDVGTSSDKLFVNTVKDTDSSFAYSSASAWITNPTSLGSFMGGSGHATANSGASVVYTFQGVGVSLYGPVGPNGAPYTAQLDNNSPQSLSSNKVLYKSQVLLYHANNLPPGQHRLTLTCQPSTSGQTLAVDYANVYTTTPPQAVNQASSGLAAGPVVGIALSIVGLFGILAALFFLLRWRKRKQKPGPIPTSFDPEPPTTEAHSNMLPTPFPMSYAPSPAMGAKQQSPHEVHDFQSSGASSSSYTTDPMLPRRRGLPDTPVPPPNYSQATQPHIK